MLELNNIYNMDCLDGLRQMEDNSVDLTVTSPPYDNLRKYADETKGECEWNFDIFKPIADELFRVTKKGGVVVWVVGDACVNGGETGSSFRQALYFQQIGFKLHDTMIYEKNSSSFPARLTSQRYTQIFEYMFIFAKGKIRNDIRLIADKRNKWAGWTNWGQHSQYDAEGNLVKTNNIKPIAEFSLRNNIWKYPVSFNDKTNHPAVFPEALARDHILSWTLEGDTVLDPFMGSGTTAKMAMMNNRNYIGFERNTAYYEESLKRVGKYEGQISDNVSGQTYVDEVGEVGEVQYVYEEDKELEGKAELWKELTKELEDTFNSTSLGILKNLRVNLSYASKANDKRVQAVLEEKGIESPKNAYEAPRVDEYPLAPDNASNGLEIADIPYLEDIKDNEEAEIDWREYSEAVQKWSQSPEENEAPLTVNDVIRICDERIAEYFKSQITAPYIIGNAPDVMLFGMDGKDTSKITDEEIRIAEEALAINQPIKKHRGRPKGSKNKPKVKTDGGSGIGIEELQSEDSGFTDFVFWQ